MATNTTLPSSETKPLRIATSGAKAAVVGLVNSMRDYMFGAPPSVTMELEVRFGRLTHSPIDGSSRFVAGVDSSFYEEVASLFDEFDGWADIGPVRLLIEHFYTCQLPTISVSDVGECTSGVEREVEMRMIQRTDPTKESGAAAHTVNHIEKQRITNIDVRTVVDYPLGSCGVPSDWCDMRFSLSKETQIDTKNLPPIANPHHARCMVRQTYAYRSAFDGTLWHYDLTRTWSGNSRAEAEQKMKTRIPPVYEIEIELADVGRATDAQSLSQSLLMKTADLFVCSLDRLSATGATAETASVHWAPCNKMTWSRTRPS